MKAPSLFEKQLSGWLASMHFECRPEGFAAGIFPVLHIFKDSQCRLALILIEPAHLAAINTFTSWPACIQYIRENRKAGMQTIALWEDFWVSKPAIVKSRLAAALGFSHKIPARLTQVRRIDKATADHFLAENHLNGFVSAKYKFGLFLPARYFRVLSPNLLPDQNKEELLVAVATFSFARIFTKPEHTIRSHELIRFASLNGSNIVGGLDKLLKAFIRDKLPDDIMTYADVEWSAGAGYERLGFVKISETSPEIFYIDLQTMQRQSKKAGVENFSQNHIEIPNMGSIKYVRIIQKDHLNEPDHAS